MCPSDRRTFYRTGTIGVLDAGAARHLTVRLPASPATVVEASGHRAAVPLSEPILRTVAREISAIQLEAETFRPPPSYQLGLRAPRSWSFVRFNCRRRDRGGHRNIPSATEMLVH